MGSTASSGRDQLFRRIYQVVRRIPRGTVATYGQVAELAGIPGGARVAGTALKALKSGGHTMKPVPWQRVVGKRSATSAGISIHDPVGGAIQRQLLEQEGIEFSPAGTISLARYGWLPGERRARGARRGRRR